MNRTASRRFAFVFAAIATTVLSACSSTLPTRPSPGAAGVTAPPAMAATGTAQQAVAALASASGTLVSGRVVLAPAAGGVRVTGDIGGLARNGAHSLQVHERGDCSAVDARSAGAYFDPARGASSASVGGSRERIVADGEGVSHVALLLPMAVLGGGAANDIAGRALVVLGASGNAQSARIACGVIRITK